MDIIVNKISSSWKSHPGIDKSLHDQVQFTTKESRNPAYQHSDNNIQRGRGKTNKQRNTSPVENAAQEVLPQLVGTQQILA